MIRKRRVAVSGLAILVLCLGAVSCARDRGIHWHRSLADALSNAVNGNKLIITDLYTDWCGWCKEMDRNTWANPDVIRGTSNYVFLKLNAETEKEGVELQQKFGVDSYPTVLLLDHKGEEFGRMVGYFPATKFLDKLKSTLEDPDSPGNLRTAAEKNPGNLQVRFKLAKLLFNRNAYLEANASLTQILEEDPGNESGLMDSALLYLAMSQASSDQIEDSLHTIDRLIATYPASKLAPGASLLSGEILMRAGRKEAARARIEGFLKDHPGHHLVPQAKRLLQEM